MVQIAGWLEYIQELRAWGSDVEGAARAQHHIARLILDKPSWISLERNVGAGKTVLPLQLVRVEFNTRATTAVRASGDITSREFSQSVMLIGFKGHPVYGTLDALPGDRFVLNGLRYEIKMVMNEIPASVQAWADLRS